ncbi:MAG: MarR family transcriptional regulator [Denitrovibrio sp.]|nr:MAG: MarR family transcriptional regulator [Denitrovibrio sp.]
MKDYKKDDIQNMKLVFAIYKGMKAMRKQESEKILEAGVTFPQFEVLVVVYHFNGITVNGIIERTLSTIGNISFVISNLIKDGMLKSESCKNDKRSKIISLTEKGQDFMDDFFPKHLKNLEDIFSIYNHEEKEIIVNLLKRLSS